VKVLVLADGASIHTQRWMEGLSQAGNSELYLLSMNPAPVRPEITKIPNVKGVHQVAPAKIAEAGNNFQYLFQLPMIRKIVREIDPAVITALYLPSYGFVGALIKGSAKLLQFIVGGDVMIFPDQGLANKMVTKFTLARSEFVVSASETMSKKIVNGFNYRRENILTQQYGLPDWVIEYPEKPKEFDFVSNRAWVSNSNIDYFLKVLKELPESKTAMIGSVVPGSDELGHAITNLACQIPGCELVGGMPYEQNIDVVARGKFHVSVTSSDGASLSVMEAMAVGAIPIVSDIAPNREWIKDRDNGFLVPLDDKKAAVQCFRRALDLTDAGRMQMIEKNRKIIYDRGSLRRNMGRVDQVLKQLEGT